MRLNLTLTGDEMDVAIGALTRYALWIAGERDGHCAPRLSLPAEHRSRYIARALDLRARILAKKLALQGLKQQLPSRSDSRLSS